MQYHKIGTNFISFIEQKQQFVNFFRQTGLIFAKVETLKNSQLNKILNSTKPGKNDFNISFCQSFLWNDNFYNA